MADWLRMVTAIACGASLAMLMVVVGVWLLI